MLTHKGLDTPVHAYHTTQQPHTWLSPRQNQNLCSQKNLHVDVWCNFIHKHQSWKSNIPQRLGGQAHWDACTPQNDTTNHATRSHVVGSQLLLLVPKLPAVGTHPGHPENGSWEGHKGRRTRVWRPGYCTWAAQGNVGTTELCISVTMTATAPASKNKF